MWTDKYHHSNPRVLIQIIWKGGSRPWLRQLLETIIVSNSFLPLYQDQLWQELSPAPGQIVTGQLTGSDVHSLHVRDSLQAWPALDTASGLWEDTF